MKPKVHKFEKINLKIVSKPTFQSLKVGKTKQSLFLYLFLLFTICSFSQTKYGVKGGLNLADVCQSLTLSGQSISTTDVITSGSGSTTTSTTTQVFHQTLEVSTTPLISFYIGGYMETTINKKKNLSLSVSFLYTQNGTNVDAKTNDPNQDISYSSNGGKYIINQLNLPVLLKFTTNKKIAFLGGCYFGTLLSAKAINNNGSTKDLKSGLKDYDFGLSIGLAYPIQKKISAEIVYNRGITNLDPYKASLPGFDLAGQFYNRTIHFGMTYQFN